MDKIFKSLTTESVGEGIGRRNSHVLLVGYTN